MSLGDGESNKVCEGAEVKLKVEFTNGVGPYDFTISGLAAVTGYTGATYISVPVGVGTYELTQFEDKGAGCEGTRSGGPIKVENHPVPNVSFASGNKTEICDNGSSTTLAITADASVTSIIYNDGGADQTLAAPFEITTSEAKTYTLKSSEDNHGCTTTLSEAITVSFLPAFDTANYSVECDPNNDETTFNYIIRFDIVDASSIANIDVAGATGSFTGTTWTSNPINEETATTLTIKDNTNDCKTITLENIKRTCSRASVDFVKDIVTVCKGTEGVLKLQTSGTGTVVVSYTQDGGAVQTLSSSPYEIKSTTPTEITLTNVKDDKFDTPIDPVIIGEIKNHPDLTATAVAECDPNNDAGTNTWNYKVKITVTEGEGNYTIGGDITDNFTGTTWESGLISETEITNLTLSDGNGCKTLTLNNLSQTCSCTSSATLSVSSTNTQVCASGGDPVELTLTFNGVGPFDYTLLKDNVSSATGSSNGTETVTVTEAGDYTLSFTDTDPSKNCGGLAGQIVTITNYDTPTGTITSNTEVICDNGTDQAEVVINLTQGLAPFTYIYSINGTDQATQTSATNSATIQTNTAGTYKLTSVTDNRGCESTSASSDEVIVTVLPEPNPILTATDVTLCEGEARQVTVTPSVTTDELKWYRNDIPLDNSNTPDFTITKPGVYKVEQFNDACTGYFTKTFTVDVTALPIVNAGPDLRKEHGVPFILQASINDYETFVWSELASGGGLPLFQSTATTLNPTLRSDVKAFQQYTYVLRADNRGCTGSDSVNVSIFIPTTIYNTFSPNGDGVNDEWVIGGLERYEKVSVKIFDRWGQQVYENREKGAWDGKNGGNTVPVGTYYYVIELSDPVEENKTETGYITVIK